MMAKAILNPAVDRPSSRILEREMAKKPLIESRVLVRGNAKVAPARDSNRRHNGQPGVDPPGI